VSEKTVPIQLEISLYISDNSCNMDYMDEILYVNWNLRILNSTKENTTLYSSLEIITKCFASIQILKSYMQDSLALIDNNQDSVGA